MAFVGRGIKTVRTDGNQTIDGVKTFNDAVIFNDDTTFNDAATFNNAITLANGIWNSVGDDAYIGDANISGSVCVKGANANTGLALFARNTSFHNGFYIDETDGEAIKLINPSHNLNRWGSVVALISQSMQGNGYAEFSDGLIVQWGYGVVNNTVTLPTPFKTTYKAVATQDAHTDNTNNLSIESQTLTGFYCRKNGISGYGFFWLAIGE